MQDRINKYICDGNPLYINISDAENKAILYISWLLILNITD